MFMQCFFSFLFYVYIQPFGLWQTFNVFSIQGLTWLYALYFIHFCFISPLLLGANFGFLPPEFIQVGFHLLGYFSVLIPVLIPLPLLFFQLQLSSKTLIMVLPLSHLLADQLTISSQLEVANLCLSFLVLRLVSSFVFSTCDIKYTNAQLFPLLHHTTCLCNVFRFTCGEGYCGLSLWRPANGFTLNVGKKPRRGPLSLRIPSPLCVGVSHEWL